jgi:hypothetical protein
MIFNRTALWCFFLVASAFSQTRTWHLSQDTVYEYGLREPRRDSTSIVNSGSDTLRFDSVGMEIIRPMATQMEVSYSRGDDPQGWPYWMSYNNGTIAYTPNFGSFPHPRTLVLGAEQSLLLWPFRVEEHIPLVVKRAAIETGDTLVVRLIYLAAGNRGRDTLMLVGLEGSGTPISPAPPMRQVNATPSYWVDLRGRSVARLPAAISVPTGKSKR